jgi:hypothetical protein
LADLPHDARSARARIEAAARTLLAGSLALAVTVMLVKGIAVLASGYELNHVSGVWLALAGDTAAGLFYRGLSSAGEYGGTRYFPLLFVLVAAAMKLGLTAITAGQVVSVAAAACLVAGAFSFLKRAGVQTLLAAAGATLALVPYFVQQTVLSIRAEPLAAACALWGAASVAGRLGPAARRPWLWAAGIGFTLAVAAKPTAGYAAVAGVAALAFAGRWRDAGRLSAVCTAGFALVLLLIWVGSAGRAPESFAALALAGARAGNLFGAGLVLRPLDLVLTSRFLTAILAIVLVVVASRPRDVATLPALLVLGAAAAAAVVLQTPGTILTNQAVEPYVAAVLYLSWAVQTRATFRPAGHLLIALLLLWAAAHEGRAFARLHREGALAAARAAHAELRDAVLECGEPLLAESPLVPLLAGRRPLLLDPFAFRVAALTRPDLNEDLVSRLEAREFRCVFLEHDPEVEPGRGWYRNVSLGEAVVEAVVGHYRLRGIPGGQQWRQPTPGDESSTSAASSMDADLER